MNEEKKAVYCVQCGSENPAEAKFCSNCGAKLEKPAAEQPTVEQTAVEQPTEAQPVAGQPTEPVYEKVEAEVVSEGNKIPAQEEIDIHYEEEGTYSQTYQTPEPKYYSAASAESNQTQGGNIGFAIASMVCGIVSLLCCCLSLFSLVLGIAAVVLGVIAINGKYEGKGMAIAGIVTGGIGICIWLLFMVIGGAGIFTDFIDELSYY